MCDWFGDVGGGVVDFKGRGDVVFDVEEDFVFVLGVLGVVGFEEGEGVVGGGVVEFVVVEVGYVVEDGFVDGGDGFLVGGWLGVLG